MSGVRFSVAEGECVAVIGPNGAGKSTLLQHLNGILPERLGERPSVIVGGIALTAETAPAVRRKVGFLFQIPDDQLFCSNVFEDVAFGPRQLGFDEVAVAGRVRESLDRVGLGGFDGRMPHHLSQGEKRRVCLAGVLACGPEVLVLDEPTSDLDPRGRRELKALLKEIPATKLIATHDLEMVVELCGRALLMDEGKILADGPPRTLLADEPLMFAHGLERPHILLHSHPHG